MREGRERALEKRDGDRMERRGERWAVRERKGKRNREVKMGMERKEGNRERRR